MFEFLSLAAQPPRAQGTRMTRVVHVPGRGWVPYQKVQEEELARQARIAQTQKEQYDMTYRAPISSTKALGFDFSQ